MPFYVSTCPSSKKEKVCVQHFNHIYAELSLGRVSAYNVAPSSSAMCRGPLKTVEERLGTGSQVEYANLICSLNGEVKIMTTYMTDVR
ncbi:hypothetical protein BaRGS_00010592 [Batillaria attramentaria]|uniref:Uncharacterized protein n=1 Tax=Batillaria attramentaria TaxID=370345 RepID=A0ABD0LFU9_9CAEN